MSGTDDKVGGFVFRRSLSGEQAQGTEEAAPQSLQPTAWTPHEVGALQQRLRDLRGWSQERLCKILIKRYDPGWDRIKALLTLEAMELAEETSLWAVGLVYGTLFELAPEELHDFWAVLATAAVPPDGDTTPYAELPSHDLKELVEWVTLDSLEPEGTKALLQLLAEKAEAHPAYQPAESEPLVSPKAPVSMASTQQIQPDPEGGPGFTLRTSRSPEESNAQADTSLRVEIPEDTPAAALPSPPSALQHDIEIPQAQLPPPPADLKAASKASVASSTAPTNDAAGTADDSTAPTETPWVRPNLEGAVLNGSDLSGAVLKGANLRGAQLQGANLKGTDLEGADLEGADLAGANLRGANLQHANLQDADLRSAIMREALIQGANLKNAKV